MTSPDALMLMFDAAFPPASPYPGAAAVAGYIGGNTPHVWTPAEWQRFAHLAQFPIWVGYQENHAGQEAQAAASAMHRLGWAPNRRYRRACVLDFETEQNPDWVGLFAAGLWSNGYETIVYGSQSTIDGNPPKEGRWIALYNGQPDIPADPYAVGHQFRPDVPYDGTQVDLSVITPAMLAHGGTGPRKG